MKVKFQRTPEHAPEPGLGGAEYEVTYDGTPLGKVRSSWNRTNGVHWVAERPDGTAVTYATTRMSYAFETRKMAADRLAHEYVEQP